MIPTINEVSIDSSEQHQPDVDDRLAPQSTARAMAPHPTLVEAGPRTMGAGTQRRIAAADVRRRVTLDQVGHPVDEPDALHLQLVQLIAPRMVS